MALPFLRPRPADPPRTTPAPPPGLWRLLGLWAAIGTQSFGGGATTILLIRQTFVTRTGWLTDDEYTRLWALSNLTPGINIAAFVILVGRKLAGIPGLFISLIGMFLPSAGITALLTALYAAIQNQPSVTAVMRGVVPAVVGLYFVIAVQFGAPLIRRSYAAGWRTFAVSLAFVAVSAALLVLHVASVVVLVAGAICGAFLLAPRPVTPHVPSTAKETDA